MRTRPFRCWYNQWSRVADLYVPKLQAAITFMEPQNEQAWYWAGEEDGTSRLAPWHERTRTRRRQRQRDETPSRRLPYEIVLHNVPIPLDEVEYRIVLCLASRPYHAFSPDQIINYVNERAPLVDVTNLQQRITDLRTKLGFFRDFVQSVPHIGYRFKP